MTNSAVRKSLSVSQRLWTLGGAAFLGFGTMLGVGWYENMRVDASLRSASEIQTSVNHIDDMRLANLTMVLAAMDIIVDKDDKTVEPERIKLIGDSLTALSGGSKEMRRLAEEMHDDGLLKSYDADVAAMGKAIQVDLVALVQQGAPDAEFDKIDDTIDGAGEELTKTLDKLAADGTVFAQQHVDLANAVSREALILQIGLGIFAILSMGILQYVHGGSIRRGIGAVRESMQRIMNGDFASDVAEKSRGDEIGEMARAADSFRLAAIEKRNLETQNQTDRQRSDAEHREREAAKLADAEALNAAVTALGHGLTRLSEGDVTVTIDQPFREELERLRRDFNQTTATLRKAMSDIAVNSSSIEANSRQMRAAADDLAKRTEQQAASLEETSAALDQITATVRNATNRAEEVGHMVTHTRENTAKSDIVVGDAMAAMQRIEGASREIGKIINVIDEIAFQTNLLALNAGVEAARAGRAAGAAKDIKALIGKSGDEVKIGGELVTAAGEALRQIGEDVLRIDEHVKSIVTSAREQSVGLNEINTSISQMDQVTQKNAAMVEETNAASHTLAIDAENLTQLVKQFKTGEGMSARQTPREANAASHSRPSPARNLIGKVAGAFNGGSAAKVIASPAGDNWEEF